MAIFFCKIFDEETGLLLTDLYNYQLRLDEEELKRIPRCPHCNDHLTEEGECRDERCFSHYYHDDGERKEWTRW